MASYSSKSVVRSFGGPETDAEGDFLITQGQSMAYNDGKVYISEMLSHYVRIFQATDGSLVKSFGGLGFFDGEFNCPAGIAFADGKAIVCDLNNGRLQTFDLDGNCLSEFGSKGDGPGSFDCPSSVCTDAASGNIFVAEAGNKRVQVFDKELNHKSFITGPPFLSCNHVGYDHVNNRLIVSDAEADTVSLFDPATGQSVGKLEGGSGDFSAAQRAACDASGNFIVCGVPAGSVSVFDKDGKKIGAFASGYEFSQPQDISVSDSGEIFILERSVATGWSRVTVF